MIFGIHQIQHEKKLRNVTHFGTKTGIAPPCLSKMVQIEVGMRDQYKTNQRVLNLEKGE